MADNDGLGDNPGCGMNGFNATAGWDPVTGLGTPVYARLLKVVLSEHSSTPTSQQSSSASIHTTSPCYFFRPPASALGLFAFV